MTNHINVERKVATPSSQEVIYSKGTLIPIDFVDNQTWRN
jgi:hypothetical protein